MSLHDQRGDAHLRGREAVSTKKKGAEPCRDAGSNTTPVWHPPAPSRRVARTPRGAGGPWPAAASSCNTSALAPCPVATSLLQRRRTGQRRRSTPPRLPADRTGATTPAAPHTNRLFCASPIQRPRYHLRTHSRQAPLNRGQPRYWRHRGMGKGLVSERDLNPHVCDLRRCGPGPYGGST